jgi:hypothetical protein
MADELNIDLEFYSNDTADHDFILRRVKSGAEIERGRPRPDQMEPIDLTGCSLSLGVMDDDHILQTLFTTGDEGGLVIIDPAAGNWGIYILTLPLALKAGRRYRYDVVLTYANGYRRRLWGGTWTVLAGVTP